MGQFSIMPTLPLFIRAKGGNAADVGLAMLLNFGSSSLLSVPMGAVSDRLGRRRVAMIGAATGALAHFALPFGSNPLVITAIYTAAGISHAAYGPTSDAMVGDIAKAETMGKFFGWSQTFRQFASFFGPAVGGIIATYFGVESSFIAAGLFMGCGAVVAVLVLQSPSKTGRPVEGLKSGVLSVVRDIRILTALVATASLHFSAQAFRAFLPLYAQDLSYSPATIGLFFTVIAFSSVVARLAIGPMLDKIGSRVPFVIGGLLLSGSSVFLTSVSTSFYSLSFLCGGVGFAVGMAMIAQVVIISERAPQGRRGLVMGLNNSSLYGGQAAGSAVEGALIQSYGYEVGFRSMLIPTVAASILLAYTSSRKTQAGKK